MEAERPATHFASAERSTAEDIARDATQLGKEDFFSKVMDFLPLVVLILDKNRQLVFANKHVIEQQGLADSFSVLGRRPGEVLNCIHAGETSGGCGTTEYCRYCGAVNAILKSQKGEQAVEECRIMIKGALNEEALDLRVWATPFIHHCEPFTCFAAVDIADEKQKLFMERIFLHDIMNTASALRGFSDLIREDELDQDIEKEFIKRISFLSNRIIDQINAHRQLIAAEQNELVVTKKDIDSLTFLSGLYDSYNRADMLNSRRLKLDSEAQSLIFPCDEILLGRVVGNMLKNAIEASVPGEEVTMGCFEKDGYVHFWVHNPTYMPENIRLQIFNRSFSTKGDGRGLGTYSMKYLTEKYLQGKLSFISTEDAGTTFTARYPINI